MSRLRVRSARPDRDGCVLNITPASAGWAHVGFRLHQLRAGQSIEESSEHRETCIVVLTGVASIRTDDVEFKDVGGRPSVFDDPPPGAVYVPAGTSCRITASTNAEVALCSAPGGHIRPARLIEAGQMPCEVRGHGTNTRYVRNILPDTAPADGLLVVEVITPAGHWSSYPPHKHDTASEGIETALEEVYYHRLDPPQGFAFQRVYTDDRTLDETICVENGDVVLVPRGYHPVGTPHGYSLYYLNVMAGPVRKWIVRNDPAHDWIVRR